MVHERYNCYPLNRYVRILGKAGAPPEMPLYFSYFLFRELRSTLSTAMHVSISLTRYLVRLLAPFRRAGQPVSRQIHVGVLVKAASRHV